MCWNGRFPENGGRSMINSASWYLSLKTSLSRALTLSLCVFVASDSAAADTCDGKPESGMGSVFVCVCVSA